MVIWLSHWATFKLKPKVEVSCVIVVSTLDIVCLKESSEAPKWAFRARSIGNESKMSNSSEKVHFRAPVNVFKSELREDGSWSLPQNLGYPINTVNDDVFFVLAADGKTGYYSSSQSGGYGGQDIYKIIFHEHGKKNNLPHHQY